MSLEDEKIDIQDEKEPALALNRRAFNRGLVVLALAGIGLSATPARAQEGNSLPDDDPYYQRDYLDVYRPPAELNEKEIERMQKCQKIIYKAFLNPSLALYLEKTQKADQAYAALRLAIEFPDEFEYKEESPGIYELTKRVNGNKDIPGDFYLRIEMGNLAMIDRKTKVNANGWKDWDDYGEVINKTTRKIVANKAYGVGAREWEIFEAYSIKLPWRLKELLELRAKQGLLHEKEDASRNRNLFEFLHKFDNHPKTYKELHSDDEKELGFYVFVNPDNPGVFTVNHTITNLYRPIIGLSHEGFLLDKHGDNGWKTPESYPNAIAKRYCDKIGKKCKSILK